MKWILLKCYLSQNLSCIKWQRNSITQTIILLCFNSLYIHFKFKQKLFVFINCNIQIISYRQISLIEIYLIQNKIYKKLIFLYMCIYKWFNFQFFINQFIVWFFKFKNLCLNCIICHNILKFLSVFNFDIFYTNRNSEGNFWSKFLVKQWYIFLNRWCI